MSTAHVPWILATHHAKVNNGGSPTPTILTIGWFLRVAWTTKMSSAIKNFYEAATVDSFPAQYTS